MRLYEWRKASTGLRFGDPKAAINACTFKLREAAQGKVQVHAYSPTVVYPDSLSLHVTATGEKVEVCFSADRRCARLLDHDVWYDVEGRIVPAPKETM